MQAITKQQTWVCSTYPRDPPTYEARASQGNNAVTQTKHKHDLPHAYTVAYYLTRKSDAATETNAHIPQATLQPRRCTGQHNLRSIITEPKTIGPAVSRSDAQQTISCEPGRQGASNRRPDLNAQQEDRPNITGSHLSPTGEAPSIPCTILP
ncbi:hypothetical protein NDU88_007976 [Pleurodeles waltl]|uniref:Uncharacterized protein n=1 Tax=Pleurodeles waltl TaxID=8319 RepID=A0AAV7VVX6_PLEWA|nr:hypothetical protein NDU88_007976 [Pleurodeles waltl]